MPHIVDTGGIPEVMEGSHTLRIENTEIVTGTAFEQPDVEEDKLQFTFRVMTPGEDSVSFQQQVSLNLGDKATLGNIARAALKTKTLGRDGIDSEQLHGKTFDCMVGHSSGGWPKVVNGSAYPSRAGKAGKVLVGASQAPLDEEGDEPPF